MSSEISHQIAVRAANQIVKEGSDAGLSWGDIAISCETTVAIVVAACAKMSGATNETQFATEIVETITERAHQRAVAVLLGVPYDG